MIYIFFKVAKNLISYAFIHFIHILVTVPTSTKPGISFAFTLVRASERFLAIVGCMKPTLNYGSVTKHSTLLLF